MLYGCETWSLTLREESRLRVFENRILRRLFGPKRDENGKWRRLHDEELHSLYCSPDRLRMNKSRRLRYPGHVVRMEESRSVFKILMSKPTGKTPLGRYTHRWKDNIIMDLKTVKDITVNTKNWVDSAQVLRYFVNAALNFRVS